MKRHIIFFLVVSGLTIISCGGQSHKDDRSLASDTGKAVISFNAYEHDFGKVKEGERVGCFFTFQNNGTGSLVINSATASCGCTVPKYDKKPVAPGKTGSIEVIFDTSGRNGMQTKTITVKSNATKPVVLLKITTEVINNNNN
ncbi:MAG: DUF1573 domain-containing protein [Bacteroidales bacterium]|jgi:hypothetical protein